MATATLVKIPIGSQFVQSIGDDDPEDLNDFSVLVVFDENVTGLTAADFTLTAVQDLSSQPELPNARILSFEGRNSVYLLKIRVPDFTAYYFRRPQVRSAILTLTLRANAVDQGNPVARIQMRASVRFPDGHGESLTRLFNIGNNVNHGIAAAPNRLLVMRNRDIRSFTYAGREQTSENFTIQSRSIGVYAINGSYISYFNNAIILSANNSWGGYFYNNGSMSAYRLPTIQNQRFGWVMTRFGLTGATTRNILRLPIESLKDIHPSTFSVDVTSIVTYNMIIPQNVLSGVTAIAADGDVLFLGGSRKWAIAELRQDGTPVFLTPLNINAIVRTGFISAFKSTSDITIHRDTMYVLVQQREVYTLDIRKYRPIAKNTKTTIYPIFASPGDTIDLKQFSPDAERILFDVGYNKPPFLSINTRNQLVLSNSARTCHVALKAINRIDATETGSFGFYLVVLGAQRPVWKSVGSLTMQAGSTYNLYQLVRPATGIAFKSGGARPTGSRLADGIFTIGTRSGRVEFTASNGTLTTDIAFDIDVIQPASALSNPTGYRIVVAGHDITADSLSFPNVSESLDPIVINEYKVNEATVVLRNEAGKYNPDLANNFWERMNLNIGGFQEEMLIYTQHAGGIESLIFRGIINETTVSETRAEYRLNCLDFSSQLRTQAVDPFIEFQKYTEVRDEGTEGYARHYVPEATLLPLPDRRAQGVTAFDGTTPLTIVQGDLPSEGRITENLAGITPQALLSREDVETERLLLGFQAPAYAEDVEEIIQKLATQKNVYNTDLEILPFESDAPFMASQGSAAHRVENTRIQRLPTDWVHDSTQDRILVLLSNPENHLNDLLLSYRRADKSYRVLHTFAKNVKAHRIARRNATNYSILTSGAITQDGSASEPLRISDKTAFTYDSAAQGSHIRIHNFNTATGALSVLVNSNNARKPQLGVHYYVGFENKVYVDEFEGITPYYRGTFKWVGGNLYYRYATDAEFGVARVNASGTTTRLLRETNLLNWNHLNFAFDVTSTETVYFVNTKSENANVKIAEMSGTTNGFVSTPVLNDLSAYSIPLRIRITGAGRNVWFRIRGIDENGDSVTIQTSNTGSTRTNIIPTQKFLRITSIERQSHNSGTYYINAVYGDIQSLIIKRRTSTGTVTTIYDELQIIRNPLENIATVIGVHEVIYHNNTLYFLALIGALKTVGTAETLVKDRTKSAGMALYRCNVTATTPTLTLIDSWQFVSRAGCNLTVHQGRVFYNEHSPAVNLFKPINPDL